MTLFEHIARLLASVSSFLSRTGSLSKAAFRSEVRQVHLLVVMITGNCRPTAASLVAQMLASKPPLALDPALLTTAAQAPLAGRRIPIEGPGA